MRRLRNRVDMKLMATIIVDYANLESIVFWGNRVKAAVIKSTPHFSDCKL